MFKKLKNKLIHLLGGYTAVEYKAKSNLNKVRIPVYQCEKPLVTLKAAYSINRWDYERGLHNDIDENWVKRELILRLTEQIFKDNLVCFYHPEVRFDPDPMRPIEVQAVIEVARPLFKTKEIKIFE